MQLRNKRARLLKLLLGGLALTTVASISDAAEAKPHSAKAHSSNLTGEYDFKVGRREGELYVKEIAPNKIQFALKCVWVGNVDAGDVHTGQAGGTVELKNGSGSFTHSTLGFTLQFAFAPRKCAIDCANHYCDSFGGAGVDPIGEYKKVNSFEPSAGDLEVYQ